MPSTETIVAIATPPGRGGVGIVRLSGPDSLAIARGMVRLRRDSLPDWAPQPHRAHYGHLLDRDGGVLDDALLTYFREPRSYTGEDVVEIATHGSPVVLQAAVGLALERGAQLAQPGEFTERAYLNGRIDLSQAEAVRDLIDASTVAQARLAAEQMGGSLQREVRPAKDALVRLIAALEAGVDFAEDDLETMPVAEIVRQVDAILPALHGLLSSFAHGRLLHDGLRLAIVGRPNAGKSSLFNRLLERDRAIVTPIAGTTRDVVTERAVIGGIPVELMDTAGLRDTDDIVERIGVARSREAMADADVVLHVVDASDMVHQAEAGAVSGVSESLGAAGSEGASWTISDGIHSDADLARVNKTLDVNSAAVEAPPARTVRLWNKSDLLDPQQRATLHLTEALLVSAATGEGMEALREAILRAAGNERHAGNHATLTNARQRDSIAGTISALTRARTAAQSAVPHEMLLLDLYEALHSLDTLTGQTTADDVLHTIFSTFCIGK